MFRALEYPNKPDGCVKPGNTNSVDRRVRDKWFMFVYKNAASSVKAIPAFTPYISRRF